MNLDPATRFSVAQLARAWAEYITTDTYPRFDTYLECLAAQRGIYPGSKTGGYPSGRPRRKKDESPADYYARLETWRNSKGKEE